MAKIKILVPCIIRGKRYNAGQIVNEDNTEALIWHRANNKDIDGQGNQICEFVGKDNLVLPKGWKLLSKVKLENIISNLTGKECRDVDGISKKELIAEIEEFVG